MDEHALRVLEFGKVIDILAGFASSGLGQACVRALAPLSTAEPVAHLHAETAELAAVLDGGDLPVRGLHDLAFILQELERVDVLLVEQILEVAETLRAARHVRAHLAEAVPPAGHLVRVVAQIESFVSLEERIGATFNDNGGIRSSASPRLRTARHEIQTLRGRVRGKLASLMRSPEIAPHLQDTGIREHGGRPTLAVRAAAVSRVRGQQRGRSDSGGTVFVEPEGVRQLSADLEAALDKEKEETHRILREVTALIAAEAPRLRSTLTAMAHVDMTYAKVHFARAFASRVPQLNTDGVVCLVATRHPLLLDLQRRGGLDAVVPIDVRLGDDFHTLIVTGPNTGGKTVALKTIGLLTLMAAAGIPVPAADGTSLPVLCGVWADIGDEQSLEQSLSTFSSHLTQIGRILDQAVDAGHLVLLDELGGGTDPAEGAALARALLEHLHERGVRTAVTTHISQLKSLGYTLSGVENASIEFDVDTLRPTHRVRIGTAGSSNALALARRLGLPADVLDRAEGHRQGDGSAELIAELQAAREGALLDREQARADRAEVQRLHQETSRALDEARAQQERSRIDSGQAAVDALRRLRRDLGQLRRDEPSKRALLEALAGLESRLDAELERAPAGAHEPVDRPLQVGDRVHVPSLGFAGVLQRIDARAGRAVVDTGLSPVTVDLAKVEPA